MSIGFRAFLIFRAQLGDSELNYQDFSDVCAI